MKLMHRKGWVFSCGWLPPAGEIAWLFIPTGESELYMTMFGWVLVGVTLMILVIFRPQGILGDKKELAIDVR